MAQTSVGSVFLDFRAGVASFNNDLKGIKKVLDNTARDFEKAGKNLSTAFTLPILAASVGVLKAADNFQKAQKTIAVGTGATGVALQGLKKDFQDVAKEVPNSLGETAKAISEVYTRTGQTGEAGKKLTKTFLNLSEATGTDLNANLRNGLQLFQSWGVAQEKQISTMDMFFRASQASGIGITELMDAVKGADDVLQPYGISLEQATVWMASFEKAAVDQGTVITGLQKAMATFVKAGVTDLPAALSQSIDAIRASKTDTEGLAMAMNIFGKKAAPEMFDAIKSGQVDLKAFSDEIINGQNTIKGATEANRTFFDQLAIMGNQLNMSLGGVGQTLAESLTKMQPAIQSVIENIAKLVEWFAALSPQTQQAAFQAVAFVAILGPMATWMAKIVSFGGQLVGWLRTFLVAIAGTTKELGLLEKGWNLLSTGFNTILSVGARVVAIFSQVVGWFTSGAAIATTLGVAIAALAGVFAGLTAGAALAGGDLKLFLSGFVELFYDAIAKIQELWSQLTTYISEVWGSFTTWFGQQVDTLLSHINTFLQGFGVDLPAAWKQAVQFLGDVWDKFVSWFGDKVSAISRVWEGWLSDFRSGIGAIGSLLGNDAWVKWAADSEAAAQKSKKGVEENKLALEQTVPIVKELEGVSVNMGKSMQGVAKAHEQAGKSGTANADAVTKALKGTGSEADKTAEKIKELNKQALKGLNKQVGQKLSDSNLDFLKENLKGAIMSNASQATIQSLQDEITNATRTGFETGYTEGGATLTDEARKGIDILTNAESSQIIGDISKSAKEGLEKAAKDDFFTKALPDFLSKSITESIVGGFEDGFSNQAFKDAIGSGSEFFATKFQDSFGKIFKEGMGADFANLTGAISDLGISYGISTLGANLADNKKDTKGGIISGTIGGAAAGAQMGGWVGAIVGAIGGAAAGYFAGSSGTSNDKGYRSRKNTVNFIEDKIGGTYLPFLTEQGNIILGNKERFNVKSGGSFMSSLGDVIVDGYTAWMSGGYSLAGSAATGTNAHEVGGGGEAGRPSPGMIAGPGWADQYWGAFGDEGGQQFMALGSAMTQFAGETQDQAGQIGVVLAENLVGNLDNARMLLQSMGVGAAELEEAFLQIGLSGQQSWHTVEGYFQQIEALTGEGLAAVGDIDGAFTALRDSAGRGQAALISLQNIAIEATEKGITSLEGLRESMVASGQYSEEDINAFFTALSQRGITSLDELQGASQRLLGGITADLETLGFGWGKFDEILNQSALTLSELQKKMDELRNQQVDIDINLNYNENNKPDNLDLDVVPNAKGNAFKNGEIQKFATGGVFNSPTLFGFGKSLGMLGEAGPEAILPLDTVGGRLGVNASGLGGGNQMTFIVNIDASDAQSGVEHKIMGVLQTMRESILQDAVDIVEYHSQRN